MLSDLDCYLVTDVSEQHIGSILRVAFTDYFRYLTGSRLTKLILSEEEIAGDNLYGPWGTLLITYW
jgi:hypothetical protein